MSHIVKNYFHLKRVGSHAGVLPKIWDGYQWLYGVGRDVRSGDYTDFGGGVEKKDANIVEGAFREFDEESLGVFGDWTQQLHSGQLDNLQVIEGKIGRRQWLIVILPINYPGRPFPIEYRTEFALRRQKELQKPTKGYNPRLEMSDIAWLTEEELLRDQRIPMWSLVRQFLTSSWSGVVCR